MKVRQANFKTKGAARTYADKRAALGYNVKAIIVTEDGYAVLWSKGKA